MSRQLKVSLGNEDLVTLRRLLGVLVDDHACNCPQSFYGGRQWCDYSCVHAEAGALLAKLPLPHGTPVRLDAAVGYSDGVRCFSLLPGVRGEVVAFTTPPTGRGGYNYVVTFPEHAVISLPEAEVRRMAEVKGASCGQGAKAAGNAQP